MNVGLVTLGCSKNQVDSEMILGLLKNKGFNIVSEPKDADIIIVNTCGFIESAKKEAIDTILEMAEYKNTGRCKYLIATGCLVKRYKTDMEKTMPEIDLCIGVDEYNKFDEILSKFLNLKFLNLKLDFKSRIISSNFPTCYIRISDGCNNRCAFCAIPSIRGNLVSRKMEDIEEEVKYLASQGMKEFCLISQDTSRYGFDIYGKSMLTELLRKISKIDGVKWIRLLYMYADEISDDLLGEIANNDKVCKYLDVPIQHVSDRVLRLMNRHETKKNIYNFVKNVRRKIPNIILRTTVMTGFPGETQNDFNELKTAIEELKFERLGAFAYSKEEGTKASKMKGQIKKEVKLKRLDEILKCQEQVSYNFNQGLIGKVYQVLVENISEDEKYFVCRSYMNVPDVDGKIYVKIDGISSEKLVVGDFAMVKIIDFDKYDLFASIL